MKSVLPSLLLAGWLLLPSGAQAQDQEGAAAFKLTLGLYQYSRGDAQNGPAQDVNVRHSSSAGNVWLAHYVSAAHALTQTRLGWDRAYAFGPVRLTPSLQLASAGAWNGSLAAETGDTWFVGAGLGRTNLRDSVSLNFDPNDAYTLAGGYRWPDNAALALQLVQDNRLHPDQRHLHLVYRTPLPNGHRLTLDLLFKRGLVDEQMIERTGLALTYDWPRWFVRASFDPNANFTPQDLWRLAVGTRF